MASGLACIEGTTVLQARARALTLSHARLALYQYIATESTGVHAHWQNPVLDDALPLCRGGGVREQRSIVARKGLTRSQAVTSWLVNEEKKIADVEGG